MIYRLLIAALVLSSFAVHAEESSCAQNYKKAYLQDAQDARPPGAQLSAHDLYLVYFDFSNHIETAYDEADPIFQALQVAEAHQDDLLLEFVHKMISGELCTANGSPKTFDEVLASLSHFR